MHSAKNIKTSDFYKDNAREEKVDMISHIKGI